MNSNKTIDQIIKSFLAQKDIAESSRKTYKSCVHSFFRYMISKGLSARAPRKENIIQYKAWLIEQKKSDATANLFFNAIRSFFAWAAESDIYRDITLGVKAPKRIQGFKKRPLEIEQIRTLLNSIDKESIIDLRDYAMILLAFENGLRTIESSRLIIDHVDTTQMIIFIQRKGDRFPMHLLPITENFVRAMDQYLQCRIDAGETVDGNSPLFATHKHNSHKANPLTARDIGATIQKRLKHCGLYTKQITAHSLRHSAAKYLIESGTPIYEVQKFLGHASITTTEIYIKSADTMLMNKLKLQEILSKMIQKPDSPE